MLEFLWGIKIINELRICYIFNTIFGVYHNADDHSHIANTLQDKLRLLEIRNTGVALVPVPS